MEQNSHVPIGSLGTTYSAFVRVTFPRKSKQGKCTSRSIIYVQCSWKGILLHIRNLELLRGVWSFGRRRKIRKCHDQACGIFDDFVRLDGIASTVWATKHFLLILLQVWVSNLLRGVWIFEEQKSCPDIPGHTGRWCWRSKGQIWRDIEHEPSNQVVLIDIVASLMSGEHPSSAHIKVNEISAEDPVWNCCSSVFCIISGQ